MNKKILIVGHIDAGRSTITAAIGSLMKHEQHDVELGYHTVAQSIPLSETLKLDEGKIFTFNEPIKPHYPHQKHSQKYHK